MMGPEGPATQRGQRARVAEIFWGGAGASLDRSPQAVVRDALAAIEAFEAGRVCSPTTQKPLTLMELLADLGIEENLIYASPELARGETFDERSLVFTVGVLIFERLTERHPFGTPDNPERLARIRRCEMGSGVNFFPSVPKGLRSILMRCMGPFPEERYLDLPALKQDLSRFLAQPDGPTTAFTPVAGARHAGPRPTSDLGGTSPRREDPYPAAASQTDRRLAEPRTDEPLRPTQPSTRSAAPRQQGRPSSLSRGAPMIYGLLGAAVASLLFLIVSFGRGDLRRSAPPRSRPSLGQRKPERPAPPTASGRERSQLGTAGSRLAAARSASQPPARPATAAMPAGSVKAAKPVESVEAAEPAGAVKAAKAAEGVQAARGAGAVKAAQGAAPRPAAAPAEPPRAAPPEPPDRPRGGSAAPSARPSGEGLGVTAGMLVAQTIRPCGVGERGARSFRVGVELQPDGRIKYAYASRKQGVSDQQLFCIRKRLARLQLPMGWTVPGYVEFSLRIFPDRVEAAVAGLPQPKGQQPRP